MRNLISGVAVLFISFAVIGCKGYAKYPMMQMTGIKTDPKLIGIWRLQEDTDKHNFFVIEPVDDYHYALTYMNKGGINRVFENYGAYISDINGTKFFNVTYRNIDWDAMTTTEEGYIFFKVVDTDELGWQMTLVLVTDTSMKACKNSIEVRDRIARNINNPDFYDQPVHLYKVLPLMYCK